MTSNPPESPVAAGQTSLLPESERVADILSERIRSGFYSTGTPLPTERALAADLGVQRRSVRTAIDHLVRDGLASRRPKCRPTVGRASPETPESGGRPTPSRISISNLIALIMWHGGGPLEHTGTSQQRIFWGMNQSLMKLGYHAVFLDLGGAQIGSEEENAAQEAAQLRYIQDQKFGGALFYPYAYRHNHDLVREVSRSVPLVLLDRKMPGVDVDFVGVENRGATFEATRHLIAQGHRRIAHVTRFESIHSVHDRVQGYFLMDEGWDLPDEDVMVLPGRFPSYAAGTQPENFKKLSEAVKKSGWRGLGLWMRADAKTDDFWTQRLRWRQTSGVDYWKVDYGNNSRDEAWRRHLTELGRQTAPGLTIETAMVPQSITWGDTYRAYDVDALLSVPQTLGRVVTELQFKAEPPAKGLINCEDEVYLGAALGCAYGVMRHSFAGDLPSGRQDFVFPPLTRDLKHCTDEVVRAVRWHRIAPAFAVGANPVAMSSEQLTDNWRFQKDESWRLAAGKELSETAPAAVTRGLPLPKVTPASGSVKPFVLASRNPNGAVAVATLGRTLCPNATDRRWITGEVADVTL